MRNKLDIFKRLLICLAILALPVFSLGCEADDDFYEDGGLTRAIYATGDAVSQVIAVSAAAWGPYIR